ncbi:Protein YicC [hydrothermal vent metagenome]|uniref:Protein YicC n=1 Tax=hydrothermal vent metagenome TaxID=652676 RepID=A0A3B0Z492_9ZZZZ
MICSLTSYARSEEVSEFGNISWDIRTVNHRFLDVSVRLPDEYKSLETKVRARVGARLSRGKIDCSFRFQPTQTATGQLHLNRELVTQLSDLAKEVNSILGSAQHSSALELLKWPGVIAPQEQDREAMESAVLNLLESTLNEVIIVRQREGEKLKEAILQRCGDIDVLILDAQALLPEILAAHRERVKAKISELDLSLDTQRLEQEVALLAQKMDVDEELDRLKIHIMEVRRVLEQGGAVGRRLDFLMQECNREVNTFGAKSISTKTTAISVNSKVLIEQMREQIQNIE